MAGIGFKLKKIFYQDSFSSRTRGFAYAGLITAGPWISAVLTVNILIGVASFLLPDNSGKELFMGTIVYSFVFSQIVTAPWQLLITRYISDILYQKNYEYLRSSYMGLQKINFVSSLVLGILFYYNKALPFHYKVLSVGLFIIISMLWILMVYLNSVKNYEDIAKAYIYGGLLSIALVFALEQNPIPFAELTNESNLLIAYLLGVILTFSMLLYIFLSEFSFDNNLQFDFLRYLDKVPSLFFIGLLYTTGLWVDDILMWFSVAGVSIQSTYLYAPIYDNAVFLAYLTIIPTMILFMVSVETEFYDTYKQFFGYVNGQGTMKQIEWAKDVMKKSIYGKLAYTFEIQALITITTALVSRSIFVYFNTSLLIWKIFVICMFGAMFNINVLLIILVMLYFEMRVNSLIIAAVFCFSNILLNLYFIPLGLDYYGYGFTIGSLIGLVVAIYYLTQFMKETVFISFAKQPLFYDEHRGFFTLISDHLNNRRATDKYMTIKKGVIKDDI